MRAKEQNTWAYRHIGVDWTCPVTDHRKWGKWGTGASCWGGWRRRQQGRNRWCGLPTASKKLRQRVERYLMQRSTHGTHCLPYIAVHWSRQSIRFLATFAPSGLTHVESDSHLRLHERPWRCGPLEPAAGLNRAVRCGATRRCGPTPALQMSHLELLALVLLVDELGRTLVGHLDVLDIPSRPCQKHLAVFVRLEDRRM
jgi:hypothetical protein